MDDRQCNAQTVAPSCATEETTTSKTSMRRTELCLTSIASEKTVTPQSSSTHVFPLRTRTPEEIRDASSKEAYDELRARYDQGQAQHGGNLDAKVTFKDAKQEVYDLVHYLHTLETKYTQLELAYANRGEEIERLTKRLEFYGE